jgi:ABC-2 type transport system permease protein
MAMALPLGLYFVITQAGSDGRPAAVVDGGNPSWYALVAMATLGATGAALTASGGRLADERANGWIRTLVLLSMSRFDMLMGRFVAGVVGAGVPILIVLGTGVLLHRVGSTPSGWLLLVVTLWIGAVPFVMLGVVVGLTLRRHAAVAAAIAIYLGFAYVGGLLEPVATPPVDIATIGHVLPSFLLDDLGWHELLGQGLSARDVTLLAAESLALGSLMVWNRRSA